MNDNNEMQKYLQLKAALVGHLRSAQGRTWWRQTQDTADAGVTARMPPGSAMIRGLAEALWVPIVGVVLIIGSQLLANVVLGGMAVEGTPMMAMRTTIKPLIAAIQAALGAMVSIHCIAKALTWRYDIF